MEFYMDRNSFLRFFGLYIYLSRFEKVENERKDLRTKLKPCIVYTFLSTDLPIFLSTDYLSFYLPNYLSFYLPITYLSIYRITYLSIYRIIYLSIYRIIHLSSQLIDYLSINLLSIYLSIYLGWRRLRRRERNLRTKLKRLKQG